MIRAQCIVYRNHKVLMVKHQMNGEEWWCLPGGGVEDGETVSEAALRELKEECCLDGEIIRQTAHMVEETGIEMVTFLVEIGSQEPYMGSDPEFQRDDQILAGMAWMALSEIAERDRAYLWAAGLFTVPEFLDEVSGWGDEISYPNP